MESSREDSAEAEGGHLYTDGAVAPRSLHAYAVDGTGGPTKAAEHRAASSALGANGLAQTCSKSSEKTPNLGCLSSTPSRIREVNGQHVEELVEVRGRSYHGSPDDGGVRFDTQRG